MKSINKFLSFVFISFIFSFMCILNIKAVNLTSSADSVNVGKSITLNVTDVINGNEYSLSFDEGFFEVSSTTCGNRTNITSNCEMKLTAKSNLTLTEDKKVTFKIIEKAENDAVKTADVIIVANKPTTTSTTASSSTILTTTTTSSVKSNNANLKSLNILDSNNKEVVYSPEFSPSVYEYSATVASEISFVSPTVTMEDSKANVIFNNPDSLVAGENNKITITVTAEDGTRKAYVLNVKREALDGNALLSSLSITEYPDLKFKSDKFTYTIKIDKSVSDLAIQYSASSKTSVVTISGNEDLTDGSKVKILVEAEDGSKREYTLNISKGKEKEEKQEEKIEYSTERNPIIIMILSIIGFSLIGAIIHVIRKK